MHIHSAQIYRVLYKCIFLGSLSGRKVYERSVSRQKPRKFHRMVYWIGVFLVTDGMWMQRTSVWWVFYQLWQKHIWTRQWSWIRSIWWGCDLVPVKNECEVQGGCRLWMYSLCHMHVDICIVNHFEINLESYLFSYSLLLQDTEMSTSSAQRPSKVLVYFFGTVNLYNALAQ